MPYSEDEVYKPENLRFATQGDTREPTLYFRTKHGSGRLRQEHGSGPKIQEIRKHTSHAFFETKEQQVEFSNSFTKNMTRSEFRALRKQFGGRHTPTEGFHHFEATFNAHEGTGKAIRTHRSNGTVVSPKTFESLKSKTETIYESMKTRMNTVARKF